jgi:GntR family transcriptional regulator
MKSERNDTVLAGTWKAPVPAYYHLQLEIRKEIEKGAWKPDSQIPTERELARRYGLSVGTVKKALLNLVGEGYLYRIQGKGTFVAGTDVRRRRIRYYSMLRRLGDSPASMDIELLSVERIPGREQENRRLKLRPEQDLFLLRRLFHLDGDPIILSESYLPERMFPALDEKERSFFEDALLYIALEKDYGVTTVSNQELFGAAAAGKEAAETLSVEPGSPLLTIEMLSYTYKNKPYEYRISWSDTREWRLSVKL